MKHRIATPTIDDTITTRAYYGLIITPREFIEWISRSLMTNANN